MGRVIAFYSSREAQNTNTDFALVDRGSGSETNPNPANLKPAISQVLLKNPTKWPVVRFTNGMTKLCIPTDFTIENVHGRLEASRTQVYLKDLLEYRCSMLDDTDPANISVGFEYPQITGTNVTAC